MLGLALLRYSHDFGALNRRDRALVLSMVAMFLVVNLLVVAFLVLAALDILLLWRL